MSYIEKNLTSDEKLICMTQLHWIILVIPCIYSACILLFIYFQPFWRFANIVGGAVVFYLCVPAMVRYLTCEYGVSTHRVLAKEGLIKIRTYDTLLSRIESVQLQQSLVGRLLGYGSLVISGTGGDKTLLPDIDQPEVFRQQLMSQLSNVAR